MLIMNDSQVRGSASVRLRKDRDVEPVRWLAANRTAASTPNVICNKPPHRTPAWVSLVCLTSIRLMLLHAVLAVPLERHVISNRVLFSHQRKLLYWSSGTTSTPNYSYAPLISTVDKNTLENKSDDESRLCPDGPPPQWESQLDPASKAFLSPIVFIGKLISLSSPAAQSLPVAATFLVQKQIKTLSAGTIVRPGEVVTLHFILSDSHERGRSPVEDTFGQCAVVINATRLRLDVDERYILFASSSSAPKVSNATPSSPPVLPEGLRRRRDKELSASSASDVLLEEQNRSSNSILISSMSAFTAPELLDRRSSRLIRKVLCRRCGE